MPIKCLAYEPLAVSFSMLRYVIFTSSEGQVTILEMTHHEVSEMHMEF